MTLGHAACEALLATFPGEEKDPATKKLQRFILAKRSHQDGLIDVSVNEVADIKDRIGKGFPTNVIGASFPLLDLPTPQD